MKYAIEIHHLNKSFKDIEVLKDTSLQVKEGECLAIMGESGSGKSTLAKILIGLEEATSGEIKVFGEKNSENKEMELLFQNSLHSLNPKMKVEDLILEPLLFSDPQIEKENILENLMTQVGLSLQLRNRKSFELSGGEQQRVCLARTLSTKPKIIILDESLSGLDPLIQSKILKLLRDLQLAYKLTYVFISHDLELCYYLADKIIVLEEGRIIEEFVELEKGIEAKTVKGKKLLQETLKELEHYRSSKKTKI